MAIVRVAIIERTVDKRTDFLVRPSVVFLQDDDVLRVLNTTSHQVTITPPKKPTLRRCPSPLTALTALGNLGISTNPVAPCSAWNSRPVKSRKAHNVFCRYHVEVTIKGTQRVARGNSDPVIIIDNP